MPKLNCRASSRSFYSQVYYFSFIKVNLVNIFIKLKKYLEKGKNWHLGAGLVAWHKVHRHCEHCFLDLFIWINLSPLKRLVKEKMNVKNKKDYRLIFFSFLFSGKRHHPAAKDFYQVELLIFNKRCVAEEWMWLVVMHVSMHSLRSHPVIGGSLQEYNRLPFSQKPPTDGMNNWQTAAAAADSVPIS